MNKRKLQKENTGKRLFDSAISTFTQKGFLNTSIDDLTRSAGVSHGNFFLYYSKREDLIVKAIEEIGKSIYERFLELANDQMDLEHVLGVHLDVIKEYESVYYFLVTEGPFLPEQARTALFVLQNGICYWMGKTVKNESLKASFPYFFNLWLANIHYYLQNRDVFSPDGSVIDKYRGIFIDIFKQFEGGFKNE